MGTSPPMELAPAEAPAPKPNDDDAMTKVLKELAKELVGTEKQPLSTVPRYVHEAVYGAINDTGQRGKFLLSAKPSQDNLEVARNAAKQELIRPEFAGLALAGALAAFAGITGSSGGFAPALTAALAVALGARAAWRLWLCYRYWRFAIAAEKQWRDVLLRKVLKPFFMQKKNGPPEDRLGDEVVGTRLQPTDYGHDPEYAVTTDAMRKVSDASRTITAGSIGVSGPRGAGKSTILSKLDTRFDRDKPERDIRVYVSAPVDYDAREFIIHLFSELCVKVLAEAPPLSPIAGQSRRQLSRLRFLSTYSNSWAPSLVPSALLAPLGLAGVASALGGLAWTPGRQKAEQPVGLPAIVEQFRAYSGQAAEWARSDRGQPGRRSGKDDKKGDKPDEKGHQSEGRVIICIDEMDKIRDSDRAVQFLNGIKAIFDVPGCLYLVSVSEDAMAIFASQTPAIKTAFDSAFDEIIRVEPMTFKEARDLLDLRVTGVPLRFLALCHVLSGGVPRELIRASRSLYQVAKGSDAKMPLAMMTQRLVRDRCEVMRREAILQLGRGGAPSAIIEPLYQENWPGRKPARGDEKPAALSSAELVASAKPLAGVTAGERADAASTGPADAGTAPADDEWRRMCLDIRAALLFYAAVIDLFTEDGKLPDEYLIDETCREIDDLAIIRHAMRMNSEVAMALLEDWANKLRAGSGHARQ